MCGGRVLFLIEYQIVSLVGHLPVSSSMQACVMPKLYDDAALSLSFLLFIIPQ